MLVSGRVYVHMSHEKYRGSGGWLVFFLGGMTILPSYVTGYFISPWRRIPSLTNLHYVRRCIYRQMYRIIRGDLRGIKYYCNIISEAAFPWQYVSDFLPHAHLTAEQCGWWTRLRVLPSWCSEYPIHFSVLCVLPSQRVTELCMFWSKGLANQPLTAHGQLD